MTIALSRALPFLADGHVQLVLDAPRRHAATASADRGLHSQLIRSGIEPWEHTPAELQRAVEVDDARWAKVVKAAQIQAG